VPSFGKTQSLTLQSKTDRSSSQASTVPSHYSNDSSEYNIDDFYIKQQQKIKDKQEFVNSKGRSIRERVQMFKQEYIEFN
jgi:hypothetical protein